jgi:ribosomal protein S18 acetylase RimI-like enzyme
MITHATLADVPQLNDLVNGAYRGDTSRMGWTTEADLLDGIRIDEERLAAMISMAGSVILKCTNEHDDLIGCVQLERHVGKLYLGMFTVSPLLQGRGTGKRLLLASEEEARIAGSTAIYMTVIDGRTELINWYLRHGYSVTGERKPFPSGDPRFGLPKKFLEFIVMEKRVG